MNTTTLQVDKTRLSHTRLHTAPAAPLTNGQVRVRVESFSLTANNITYAAFGDAMSYWQFWPTGDAGWGVVPVWGFGAVTESQHPTAQTCTRFTTSCCAAVPTRFTRQTPRPCKPFFARCT